MKKLSVWLILILTITVFSGCMEIHQNFEIHEWGVFVESYRDKNTSALTEPPYSLIVRKPVIYFHGLKRYADIFVKIDNIEASKVIPDAIVYEHTIFWGVTVKDDQILLPNGSTYPYLFYEGKINYTVPADINITFTNGKLEYTIRNNCNYTLHDFILVCIDHNSIWPYDDWREILYFGDIEPNETVTLADGEKIDMENAENIIKEGCMDYGLDENEAEELINYWSGYWFSPYDLQSCNRAIFIVPQDVYDSLLPISVIPEPSDIKRVGVFTITDIPIAGKEMLGNISVNVSTDKQNLSLKETLNLSVMLTNLGNVSINLSFPNAQIADFMVVGLSDGSIIYRWSDDKFFAEVITNITVKPNETITVLESNWQPQRKGEYLILAWIVTNPPVYAIPVEINVN